MPPPADPSAPVLSSPREPSTSDQGIRFEDFLPKHSSGSAAQPSAAPPLPEPDEEPFGGSDIFVLDGFQADAPTAKRRRGLSLPALPKGAVRAVVLGTAALAVLTIAVPRLVKAGSAMLARQPTEEPMTPPPPAELSEAARTEAYFLAERALQDALASLDGVRRDLGVERAPPRDWMEGIYLAHGSRYPGVQSYWERYGSYLQYAQRELPKRFEASLRRYVSGSALAPGDRDPSIDLVLEDFHGRQASADEVFAEMGELAQAALELHAFLVLKEEEIDYTPFTQSGVSRDPIVEAVPQTEQTKTDLWERLGRVTSSLEGLDALDTVTTARLQQVLVQRLDEVWF